MQRRLPAATGALEALCRRFRGFGATHPVSEQTACLRALAALGGPEARLAVKRLLDDRIILPPGYPNAAACARILGCRLDVAIAQDLLRHADPAVRADAAACAPPLPPVIAILTDLMDDLHPQVAQAAAVALGHMGHSAALPPLLRLLASDPTREVIDAVANLADGAVIVLFGRLARTRPDLAPAVRQVLAYMEDPVAQLVLVGLMPSARQGADSAGGIAGP